MTYFDDRITDDTEPTEAYETRTLDDCAFENASYHRAIARHFDPAQTFVALAMAVVKAEQPVIDIVSVCACETVDEREAQVKAERATYKRIEWEAELA